MNIRKGVQSWAEILYTYDGTYIKNSFGDIIYTVDGNYIRQGNGNRGFVKYTIEGNCICENGRVVYSIHGNLILEGMQSWGNILYNMD